MRKAKDMETQLITERQRLEKESTQGKEMLSRIESLQMENQELAITISNLEKDNMSLMGYCYMCFIKICIVY